MASVDRELFILVTWPARANDSVRTAICPSSARAWGARKSAVSPRNVLHPAVYSVSICLLKTKCTDTWVHLSGKDESMTLWKVLEADRWMKAPHPLLWKWEFEGAFGTVCTRYMTWGHHTDRPNLCNSTKDVNEMPVLVFCFWLQLYAYVDWWMRFRIRVQLVILNQTSAKKRNKKRPKWLQINEAVILCHPHKTKRGYSCYPSMSSPPYSHLFSSQAFFSPLWLIST